MLVDGSDGEVTDSMLIECEPVSWGPDTGMVHVAWVERNERYTIKTPPQGHGPQSAEQHHGRPWAEIVAGLHPLRPKWKPVDVKLRRGEVFPRIWRNGISSEHHVDGSTIQIPENQRDIARRRAVAFHRIHLQLDDIFSIVTPLPDNRAAYGGAIQQVLSLAAKEVEMLMGGVYRANGGEKSSPKAGDWYELKRHMRLDQWEVELARFPEFGVIVPFCDWGSDAVPKWWTAYNKLKHDEAREHLANLGSLVAAAAAVRVLLEAQFGPRVAEQVLHVGLSEMSVVRRPKWAPDELYFAPRRGTPVVEVYALKPRQGA